MILLQIVIWFIQWFINGTSLYHGLLLIPIFMFYVRKFGVKVGCGSVITTEILLIFFSTVFTILFSQIDTVKYIITIILRVISCLIIVLDDVLYVYVTEERKIK